MAQPKSAAQSLYPDLPSAAREPIKQKERTLGDAMWPSLSREQKAKEADRALWARINDHNRQVLRRGLREAVANIERREGRR
jgi:hypothetical protein